MSFPRFLPCAAALLAAGMSPAFAAAPSISGAASPTTLKPGDWVLITARVQPGTSPASSRIRVTADLSPLGRSIAQDMNDNGRYGDKVAGDGIYSYRENIASNLIDGSKTLRVNFVDRQGRRASHSFQVTVGSGSVTPPPPPAVSLAASASASPGTVEAGQSALLTARITPATEPSSSGITVQANLGAFGGSSSQAFRDDGQGGDAQAGDGVYSYRASIGSAQAAGSYALPVSVRDAQGRSASAQITLGVTAAQPSTAPSGVASASPNSALPGTAVRFEVRVTPGANPTSSSIGVSADLSSLGLSSSQGFRDDGSQGDASAGDGIYTAAATLPASVAAGSRSLSARISDAQGRSSSAMFGFTVQTGVTTPPPPPSGGSHACSGFYSDSSSLVQGKVVNTVPSLPRPAKGQRFVDPTFGTCGVRATDHAVEPPSGFARNDYSRRQAFNADNSRFIVYSNSGHWHLYDANTLQYLRQLSGLAGDAEPQWHPTDPRSLYYIPNTGGMVLNRLDVESNTTTVAASFSGKLPWSDVGRVWTKSEGSPSADGRYWCFQAETSSYGIRGVFTYDLQNQQVIGSRNLSARPDHVSMSASGRYCVVSHLAGSGGTVAWNRDFSGSKLLHGTSEHSDLALNAQGEDVYVAVDYQANAGDVFMFNIDTGVRTNLFPTYINGAATAYHFSGKAFSRPGWVLVSAYAGYGSNQWYMDKLYAVELSASPRILQIGHHQSRFNGYWTEPHASVSRDFSRVIWTSNWGSTSDMDVDTYMIHLAPQLIP